MAAAALAASVQAVAAPASFEQTQFIPGPINFPTVFEMTFTTPTGTALTDGALRVHSQGDWSWPGGAGASPEMMRVLADGVEIDDNLFQFDADLDPGSNPKNDNSAPITQTISIPIGLLATFIADGSVVIRFELTDEVNVADQNSFIEGRLSFRFDDAGGVPEPTLLSLVGLGLLGLGASRRRRKA